MKNTIFLITALFTIGTAYTQVEFSKIVPPSPNVASLFKSTLTPVTEYSGLPNVSIPIVSVSEGHITVPVSLSYHTGGIQVSEESGVVGLGWALNAGGAITRNINGLDDFMDLKGYLRGSNYLSNTVYANTLLPDPVLTSGVFNPETNAFVNADSNCEFIAGGNLTHYEMPAGPAHKYLDLMPDTFHFNFNGYSGSFVFDPAGNPVLMEQEGLEIILESSATDKYIHTIFKIITEDGTIYEFGQRAETSFPNSETNEMAAYTSSWFLTKITDIAGNIVTFEYRYKDTLNQTLPVNEAFRSYTQTYEVPTDPNDSSGPAYKNIAGPRTQTEEALISKILFDSGEVRFNYSADGIREDLDGNYLKSVELWNNHNQKIRDFSFDYTYFGNDYGYTFGYDKISIAKGDYGQTIGALESQYPHLNKRLRLDRITEDGIKSHSFEYFDSNSDIPNKTSFKQDYWGFFNYAPNYESFIPEIRHPSGDPLTFSQPYKANRLPSENFAKIFSLKKITYPTGGSTEFDYELNTFDANGTVNVLPPTTVLKNEWTWANEERAHAELAIQPNQNATLYLHYSLVIRGWDMVQSSSKPAITTDDFLNDFYIILKDTNGTVIDKKTIPSSEGNTLWTNFDPVNYPGQPAIIFEFPEEYNNLTQSDYILEVHFDDHNGLLYGQVSVSAQWEDQEVDANRQYSIGGGLRIKKITDRDTDGSIALNRNYNYHYTQVIQGDTIELSYGKIKTLPNYYTNHQIVSFLKVITNSVTTQRLYELHTLPTVVGKATSHNSFSKDAGSYVGYDQVEITYEGGNGDNGKTVKYFHNEQDKFRAYTQISYVDDYYQFPALRVPHNGLLKNEEFYKREGNTYSKVKETGMHYKIDGIAVTDTPDFTLYHMYQNANYVLSAARELPLSVPNVTEAKLFYCVDFKMQLYPHYSNLIQQTKIVEKTYDEQSQNPVVTTQEFFYDNNVHLQRTRTRITESDGSVLETKVYYPDDITNATAMTEGDALEPAEYTQITKLKSAGQHQISAVVQTVTKLNDTTMSIQRTLYDTSGQYTDPIDNLGNWDIVLPAYIQTAKDSTALERRLNYEEYANGKPVQLRKEDGIPVAYVWGYNNTYPIAKIENATYGQLAAYVPNFQTYSNADNDRTIDTFDVNGDKVYTGNEGTLRQALNTLRANMPEAMVTTYTYDPLIGLTTVTDPKGYCTYYQYDTQNRLISIKDDDGHYISDHEYHYTGQTN